MRLISVALVLVCASWASAGSITQRKIGQEIAVPVHFSEEDLTRKSIGDFFNHGKALFSANWTEQEGAGRPLMKGTTRSLADASQPLSGMRSFNRFSAPDANSCVGCHNLPHGISGGSGDFVTNVFVLGQRFDFLDFDRSNRRPTSASVDEIGNAVDLNSAANNRATTGMFGAGYLEMLAREITSDLQRIRDSLRLGETKVLVSKGITFGELTRVADGSWDISKIRGLPRQSTDAPTPIDRPSLVIRPWHQAGNVVSLREFSNNAFHQHHGIQSVERFGLDSDPDGDSFTNEMTRADITAVSLYQAGLQVPGRLIPRDPEVEAAVLLGENVFLKIGCAGCHIPELPLTKNGWRFQEPGPYNPPTNARVGDLLAVTMALDDPALPLPRLRPDKDRPDLIYVPAYTDFRLHDITDPNDPTAAEPLDQNETVWSPKFRKGNRLFLTKRLWGSANEPPYFHHGQFTTLRQAVLAHDGEALPMRLKFQRLVTDEQDALIEFLKTLQVLPPGTASLVVDEKYQPREWPPKAKRSR
jgi:cytochrome c peroxidase